MKVSPILQAPATGVFSQTHSLFFESLPRLQEKAPIPGERPGGPAGPGTPLPSAHPARACTQLPREGRALHVPPAPLPGHLSVAGSHTSRAMLDGAAVPC